MAMRFFHIISCFNGGKPRGGGSSPPPKMVVAAPRFCINSTIIPPVNMIFTLIASAAASFDGKDLPWPMERSPGRGLTDMSQSLMYNLKNDFVRGEACRFERAGNNPCPQHSQCVIAFVAKPRDGITDYSVQLASRQGQTGKCFGAHQKSGAECAYHNECGPQLDCVANAVGYFCKSNPISPK
jgi:hypothetical protein